MGSLDNTEQSYPISAEAVQNADPNAVVLSFSVSDSGENGVLNVPSDAFLSGPILQFTPGQLDITQQSTDPTTSLGLRYERDVIPVPEQGGFYLKTGVDASFSHHTGRLDAQVRPFIDDTRSNILSYSRDQIAGIRDELVAIGVNDPDAIINEISSASDTAINYVLDNPNEIAAFDASSVSIPDSVPEEARAVINNALEAVEDRIQQRDVQNGLESIADTNRIYDEGLSRTYDAYGLSAGTFVEAGNAVKDVNFLGMDLDQVDYFATARVGVGATIYDMGNNEYYGCYGPEASVGFGIRGHFNENMAGVARVDHNLGLDRDCPGGVTQEMDSNTSIFVGMEIRG